MKRDARDKHFAQMQALRGMGPGSRAKWRVAGTTEGYASPSVSNIEAAMASVTDLPAHTTNWNAG